MYSASQREMIGCSSKRELSRRLSRITMEITTSLGSHTVAACFLRRLFRFHSPLRYYTVPMMCVPLVVFSSLLPTYPPFLPLSRAEGEKLHMYELIREKANDISRLYSFLFSSRGIFMFFIAASIFLNHYFLCRRHLSSTIRFLQYFV